MREKIYKTISVLVIMSLLVGCTKEVKEGYTMINGVQVKESLIDSGYYFDVASFSDAQLNDLIERITPMEKPDNIGEVIFNSPIEDIVVMTTTPSEVTDQEVEALIEKTRDRFQEERIVEEKRVCKIGDKVVVNIVEDMGDGTQGESQDMEIVLGNEEIIKEIEDVIIGKKAGEKFDVDYTYPNDIEDKQLRGKKAKYHCVLKYIKENVTPVFDDEFAMLHSKKGATNSQAYREELRENIDFIHKNAIFMMEKNDFLNKLKSVSVDISTPSEEGRAWAFNKTIVEQKRLAKVMDKTNAAMLTSDGSVTLNEALRYYKDQSMYILPSQMLFDSLQKKYNVTYTEEDKMKWFDNLCIINDYGKDVTYEIYSRSMGEAYINDNAKQDKIISEVLKHLKKEFVDPDELNKT